MQLWMEQSVLSLSSLKSDICYFHLYSVFCFRLSVTETQFSRQTKKSNLTLFVRKCTLPQMVVKGYGLLSVYKFTFRIMLIKLPLALLSWLFYLMGYRNNITHNSFLIIPINNVIQQRSQIKQVKMIISILKGYTKI